MYADRFPLLQYTKESGLPGNMVYDVYRDSKGFIWVATDKGVARFDGVSFKNFNTGDGLPDNEVFFFHEDHQHRLWLGTYSGQLCFYKNGTFYNAENAPFLKLPFKTGVIGHIASEEDSSITISYGEHQAFVNIKGNKCTVYRNWLKDKKDFFLNVSKVNATAYKILYNDEELILDTHSGIIKRNKLSSPTFYFACQGQKYLLDHQYIYNEHHEKIRATPEQVRSSLQGIHRIYFDGKNYSIATENGLYINSKLTLLKGERISSVTTDITGSYWIGTLGKGLYRTNSNFRHNMLIADAYKGSVTYACNYGDVTYFATDKRRLYQLKEDATKLLLDFSENYASAKNRGNHVDCSNYDDKIYCVGGTGSIFEYNISQQQVTKHSQTQVFDEVVNAQRSKSIIASNMGLYFASSFDVIYLPFTSLAGTTKGYYKFNKAIGSRIYATTISADHNLWLSRYDGIYIIENKKAYQVQPKQFNNKLFKWLKSFSLYFIGCTPSNELYLFTNEKDGLKARSFYRKDLVWDNAYYLGNNIALLVSDKRYYILDLRNDILNGITPRLVEHPYVTADAEYVTANNGNSYFFKEGGITVLSQDDLIKEPPLPIVYFNKIVTDDTALAIDVTDSMLTIPNGHSANASISFDVLAFDASDVLSEYCIVKNGNQASGWQAVANRALNVVLPEYGSIQILVRVKTQSGKNTVPKKYTILVEKPWWVQWWGATIITLSIATIICLLFFYFIRRALRLKEKEHATQLKLLHSEFKALNAMMNPHFIFNTINNIQGFINSDDKLLANQYISIFSAMIRQNMQNLSQELVSLSDEMMVVESYLQLQRLRYPYINFSVNIDPVVDMDYIMIPPLLIQPIVENSIKHGLLPLQNSKGNIDISIFENGDDVYIEIVDDGVGFSDSKHHAPKHISFALSSVSQRINAMAVTHGIKMSFQIHDRKNGSDASGVRVVIIVSYRS